MPRGMGRGQMWWHGRFRGRGYRITMGREAILEVLTDADKHLSAEEIYTKVRTRCPAVGLTTVYRTLEILVTMGIVFKFDFGDGRARYELTEGSQRGTHHHHLICTRCKRVIDYTDFIDDELVFLRKAEKGLSDKYRFAITNHQLSFYGLCDRCQQEG